MKEQAVNTFKGGLVMDLNPMAGDGTTLSNALNATLITNNGNELMLQNDMGNGRINKVRLDEGYIPVGIKEHGGIIYIASYNPENKKGQIGSFPYPKVEYDANDFINNNTSLDFIYGINPITSNSVCTNEDIVFNEITHSSQKIKLFITTNESGEQVQAKFKQGDSFSLIFDSETSNYLMADNIESTIVSKTTSDYITLHNITKEELMKGEPISIIYNDPHSGTLFLQISLNIPDTFDISYTYNNGQFTLLPYAYNSENPDIYTTSVAAFNEITNITNFDCGSSITLSEGTYNLYPITSDKGYLNYLKQTVILDKNSNNNIFKYTFNDGSLDLYWDILTDSHYSEGTSYRFTYNFYPLESAGNVTSLQSLQQLPYTTRVFREGYPVISGLRNLKCTLPSDTIYVLLITVAAKTQDTYGPETPCFGGFIYGTSRYNEKFDDPQYINFNTINEADQEINYTFNRQLLELNRTSITNKHLIYDTDAQEEKWEESQGIILLSDTLIPNNEIPKAYSSEIAVAITKTDEPVVVAPKQDIKFIYDSDQFSVESSKFDINLNDAEINDVPEKNDSTRIITSWPSNEYRHADKSQDSITFYRYISSESSDGQAQQTRTFKQLMPVFNPNMTNYEELFGFDFTGITSVNSESGGTITTTTSYTTTGVFGAKNYLNMTESITLFVGNKDDEYLGYSNRLLGNSEGNSSPGVIKQFLLSHSKDYRGQNISSIFDLFGGAQGPGDTGNLDDASLRLEDANYMPYKHFSGLDPNCAFKEFSDHCRFIIPSCLTFTNQALLLPLPSSTLGACYTSGYKKIEDGKYEDRSQYPKNNITPAHNLRDRKDDLLIPSFKKLFCLLSQIFTLQQQESYVYIVGPSEVTINYNVQDDSYINYPVKLPQSTNIFVDESIQEALNNVEHYLSNDLIVAPHNYIGRLKLKERQDNYFFYGREVNMGNPLYNNILSQYINAYDESIVIDNSSGYSVNDIYYLDSKKIYQRYKDITEPMQYFDYTNAHKRIQENTNYPMDQNGELVTDGEYNKLWSDYDIYYNPSYNCYQYDLSKSNFLSVLTKSTISSENYLLDWAGNCWIIPSLINSFMTVEEARNTSGSQIASYSNNFIVLRTLNTISSTWVEGNDKPGPAFAMIDLGFRGGKHNYTHTNISQTFLSKITKKIQDIINLYNHNYVATTGRYLIQENAE